MCCLTCEAAIDNDVKCMECLLREGKSCDYSLVIAAREGYDQMVWALIKAGIVGEIQEALIEAVQEGRVNVVKMLLEHGADIDNAEALHWAIYRKQIETTNVLIRNGASIDLRDSTRRGTTPLMLAVQEGCVQIVKLLIERAFQSDINVRNYVNLAERSGHEHTAMTIAALYGNVEIARVLKNTGADVTLKALQIAVKKGHPEMEEWITENNVLHT